MQARRTSFLILTSISGLALAAGTGHAEDSAPATEDPWSTAYAAPGIAAEVIVEAPRYSTPRSSTATKTDTALLDVPQAIAVVTDDLIRDQAMRSMGDVLRYVPGAVMGQGEGHRDAPTLRGNSSTADFFVDGVRDDVQYFRDVYNAERVEVLKGPNAMIFGRGGGGGVINRVTERADGRQRADFSLEGGSDDYRRITTDVGDGFSDLLALRLNAMYEDSASYRDFVQLERYGLNPTARFELSERTRLHAGLEHFRDERTVDRGLPSRNGQPADVDESTFFGNPDLSAAEATVNLGTLSVEHEFSDSVHLRNHTLYGDYDKFYQNVYPFSEVRADGTVILDAYHSGTERRNLFNQTDLTWFTTTGTVEHNWLTGVELGRQRTDNLRNNSSFRSTQAAIVPILNPLSFAPVAFDLPNQDNDVDATVAAAYVQDQMTFTDRFHVVAGVRFDRFDLEFENHLTGDRFERADDLVSPRLGAIFKPAEAASLYASYGVSYLPASGDQFSSLDATSAALEPEEFENLEVGVKWDLRPDLSFSAALYQLDRSNTRFNHPLTGVVMLTGRQRSEGVELALGGSITDRWEIHAGYAWQDAEITSPTAAAPNAGTVVPLVPDRQFSLWNAYRFNPAWRVGLGVTYQSDMYASIGNAVTLPSYTRVDGAVFYRINDHLEAQLNVDNIFDERYFATAHSDNNITPGLPASVRLALHTRF
jgi:catecholate siderophore receptor